MEPENTYPKKPLAVGKLCIRKDPRVYAEEVLPAVRPYKRIAGLDLGTNCGIAFCDIIPGRPIKDAVIIAGQWDLSLGDYDSGPLRHIRLKQFLAVLQPSLICYEEVKYTPPGELLRGRVIGAIIARVATAAEFLGGLKTTLATWAEEHGVPAHGLSIQAIKKYATGKGNASKEQMIQAANARFGTALQVVDYDKTGADNISDALFVCAMGIEAYSEGL